MWLPKITLSTILLVKNLGGYLSTFVSGLSCGFSQNVSQSCSQLKA